MPDSSDDFFSSFGNNSPAGARPTRGGPPPGPPPGSRRPPPGPPPPGSPQQQPYGQRPNPNKQNYVLSSSNNTSSSSGQQPAGQPAAQPMYYGTNNMPPQQPSQQQQGYPQPQQNDWYTPGAGNNNMQQQQPGMMQQQQPQPMAQQQPFGGGASYDMMGGTMDTSGRSGGSGGGGMMDHTFAQQPQPQMFIPQPSSSSGGLMGGDTVDFDNEPPLLEELGINLDHILMKTKAVVIPFRRFQKQSALADPSMIVEDADLAGPTFLALLLGGELLMTGKLQFGTIYGFGLFGCCAMTLVLNLLSPDKPISFWTVTSILGYALLPVNLLAAVKIILIFSIPGLIKFMAILVVLWSTTASTRLLEIGCGLAEQRYLVAYPIALLYSAFVLITIF